MSKVVKLFFILFIISLLIVPFSNVYATNTQTVTLTANESTNEQTKAVDNTIAGDGQTVIPGDSDTVTLPSKVSAITESTFSISNILSILLVIIGIILIVLAVAIILKIK